MFNQIVQQKSHRLGNGNFASSKRNTNRPSNCITTPNHCCLVLSSCSPFFTYFAVASFVACVWNSVWLLRSSAEVTKPQKCRSAKRTTGQCEPLVTLYMANWRNVCDCKVSIEIEEEETHNYTNKKQCIYRRFSHINNTWEKQCKIILFEVIDCCPLCVCVFVRWLCVCVNELNYVMTRLLHRRPYCDKTIIINAEGKIGIVCPVVLPSAHSRQCILTPDTTEWLVCVCVRALCGWFCVWTG